MDSTAVQQGVWGVEECAIRDAHVSHKAQGRQ